MNKRGQVLFLGFMIAVVIFVLALAFVPTTDQFVQDARNTTTQQGDTGLDCNNSSISVFNQGACLVSDITPAYFLGGMIAFAGIALGAKYVIQNVVE